MFNDMSKSAVYLNSTKRQVIINLYKKQNYELLLFIIVIFAVVDVKYKVSTIIVISNLQLYFFL